MKITWSHFNLPFFLSAGLVIGGGLYAISESNRMLERQSIIERQLIFNFETHELQQAVESADTYMRRYIATKNAQLSSDMKYNLQAAWTRVGTLWHLDEDNSVWRVQSALRDVHEILDRQAYALALGQSPSAKWEAEKQAALDTLYHCILDLRGRVLPFQTEEGVKSSSINLRLAVFLTPLLALIMLLIAFRYIYRMQKMENEQVNAMSRAKSQFLANMSHEIRTPLTAVVGYAEVLSQPLIQDNLREKCVSGLRRNGTLLVNLVNDILDLSKIEAEKIEIQAVNFDLGETIREVEAVMALKTQERGLLLEVALDPSAKGITCGDPIRIKQILLNIVGNALKFTLQGKVRVTAAVTDGLKLTVEVSDTGIGISAQAATMLFQPFTQIDSSNERNFGGTGLGLTISRQLAQAMGGDVRLLSSYEGRGSIFEITILLAKPIIPTIAEAKSNSVPAVRQWQEKCLLVVDDSEDNRELVQMYLSTTGIRVLNAASGDEAMQMIRHENPDAILMDIQMPVKNGYDTTREIRSLGKQMPIIAFTAHVMLKEIDQCRASGCDTVLTKPVMRENLITVLDSYL